MSEALQFPPNPKNLVGTITQVSPSDFVAVVFDNGNISCMRWTTDTLVGEWRQLYSHEYTERNRLLWVERALAHEMTAVVGSPASYVLREIGQERDVQDRKWGGADHDDSYPLQFFVQTIQDYAGWARVMLNMLNWEKARRRLMQVAALAVAAIESGDRKNATTARPPD